MSLDVYLNVKNYEFTDRPDYIFIREDGSVREITRKEWNEKFPGQEPCTVDSIRTEGEVYWANITHNLIRMAHEAGLYKYLWRPDENGLTQASQLIAPLEQGLAVLLADRKRFEKFNPDNGWGDYDGLVTFVREYLAACQQYPTAEVSVWR